MASKFLTQVRSLRCLEAAWRSVRTNGLASKSETSRKEIQRFDEDPAGNLRSLKSRLGHGSFKFPAARGVAIPKPGKKDIRPIVLAGVETRIVQRAILDVLQGIDDLQPYLSQISLAHSAGNIAVVSTSKS
jgi:RNA-directed DNA polymerase